jgi:serine/threonine protein kinase
VVRRHASGPEFLSLALPDFLELQPEMPRVGLEEQKLLVGLAPGIPARRPPHGAPQAGKVLDFGLAKMPEAGDAGPLPEDSPTLTLEAATRAGTILGTATYLSPEQARGKTADKRADTNSASPFLPHPSATLAGIEELHRRS